MSRLSKLSDSELEQLLSGRAPAGDPDLEDLAAFLRHLRSFAEEPDDVTAGRHVRRIAETAAYTATWPNKARPRSRPKVVIALALMSLLVFAGAAYAGALPGPVQGAVHGIFDQVGILVPEGGNEQDGSNNNIDSGAVEQGDQGDVDQGSTTTSVEPTTTVTVATGVTDPPVTGDGQNGDTGSSGDSGDVGDGS